MILLFEMDILHENAGWFMLVMKYPGEKQVICKKNLQWLSLVSFRGIGMSDFKDDVKEGPWEI